MVVRVAVVAVAAGAAPTTAVATAVAPAAAAAAAAAALVLLAAVALKPGCRGWRRQPISLFEVALMAAEDPFADIASFANAIGCAGLRIPNFPTGWSHSASSVSISSDDLTVVGDAAAGAEPGAGSSVAKAKGPK